MISSELQEPTFNVKLKHFANFAIKWSMQGLNSIIKNHMLHIFTCGGGGGGGGGNRAGREGGEMNTPDG